VALAKALRDNDGMWKAFDRWVWSPLGHIFRIRTLIEIGSSAPAKAAIGVVVGAILSRWAWVESIPGPFIAIVGLLGCGGTVWIWNLLIQKRLLSSIQIAAAQESATVPAVMATEAQLANRELRNLNFRLVDLARDGDIISDRTL
jgi:hypothetical protein